MANMNNIKTVLGVIYRDTNGRQKKTLMFKKPRFLLTDSSIMQKLYFNNTIEVFRYWVSGIPSYQREMSVSIYRHDEIDSFIYAPPSTRVTYGKY